MNLSEDKNLYDKTIYVRFTNQTEELLKIIFSLSVTQKYFIVILLWFLVSFFIVYFGNNGVERCVPLLNGFVALFSGYAIYDNLFSVRIKNYEINKEKFFIRMTNTGKQTINGRLYLIIGKDIRGEKTIEISVESGKDFFINLEPFVSVDNSFKLDDLSVRDLIHIRREKIIRVAIETYDGRYIKLKPIFLYENFIVMVNSLLEEKEKLAYEKISPILEELNK